MIRIFRTSTHLGDTGLVVMQERGRIQPGKPM